MNPDINDVIDDFSNSFQDLLSIVNTLPKHIQKKFLNPSTLGVVSAFLELGNGYEPGIPNYEFNSVSKLIDEAESISGNYFSEDELDGEI